MGLEWLDSLFKTLDLIDMWFGEDQRANITKTHVQKRLDYIFKNFITTLHSTMNKIGMTYCIVSN